MRPNLTLIGLALSLLVYFLLLVTGVQAFEPMVEMLAQFEAFELDELLVALTIFAAFAVLDLLRKRRLEAVEIEKARIYRAMLASSHHVLNNFLNQMNLFKLTAESTDGFPPRILALYDQIIHDTLLQIEALGSISRIDEASIRASVAPRSRTARAASRG